MQDSAARALWLLARGDRRCLSAQAGQLACDPAELAQAAIRLLEAAEAQEVGSAEAPPASTWRHTSLAACPLCPAGPAP